MQMLIYLRLVHNILLVVASCSLRDIFTSYTVVHTFIPTRPELVIDGTVGRRTKMDLMTFILFLLSLKEV